MQKLRFYFIFLLTICSFTGYAQFTISGKIIDADSKEPLNSASVYCQNTTIGTTTNKEGEFSLQLKSGGYELIISYTGYQTKQVQITHSDNRIADIEMIKEEKSLGEVIIRSSNEVKDG
ncbi:MAG: carboxypeptidase-like regulatory domain-containing protein, partial [Chitinophagaceae bacterium]